ncbi:MAG: hypothetical protein RI963_316 [Planctomycetota bacterium]
MRKAYPRPVNLRYIASETLRYPASETVRGLTSLALSGSFAALLGILVCGCGPLKPAIRPVNLSSGPQLLPAAETEPVKPNPEQAKIDLLMAMAKNDQRRGNHAAAAKKYQEVLNTVPLPEAYHRLAIVSVRLGDSAKAEQLFAQAIRMNPEHAELLADAAYFEYLRGDLAKAEQYARQGLERDAYLARLHNNLGLILAAQGKDQAAVTEFRLSGIDQTAALANLDHARRRQGAMTDSRHNLPPDATLAKQAPPEQATVSSGVEMTAGYSTK